MYPETINEEMLETIKQPKSVIPYFDIPIQYGNDEILKAMNRRGDTNLIRDKINMIRRYFPEAVIRTTILLGFPNETDETFEDTMNLINEIEFDSLGAFTYSKEEGTVAYSMKNQVDEELKQKRYEILMKRQYEIVLNKNKNRLKREYEVLIDSYDYIRNRYIGRTYMSAPDGVDGCVYIDSDEELKIGDFYDVQISDYNDYDLIGIIKKKEV